MLHHPWWRAFSSVRDKEGNIDLWFGEMRRDTRLRGALPAVTKKPSMAVNVILTMSIFTSALFRGGGARIKVGFNCCMPKKI
jgi:hypothetical protein